MSTILTDDELAAIQRKYDEFPPFDWYGPAPCLVYERMVEAAVLAKLERQEPVATLHVEGGLMSIATKLLPDGKYDFYAHPTPQQADRQRVPGQAHNYHQLREALIFADQAMAESGLLACHAVRLQIRAALDSAAAPEAPAQADRQRVPDGWKLVPVEALVRWRDAFAEELAAYDIDPPIHHVLTSHDEIAAMLSAAPEAPAQASAGDERAAFEAWFRELPNNGRKAGLTLLDAWQARAALAKKGAA